MSPTPTMTLQEWQAEAIDRFGADPNTWRFVCPACGHTASCADFAALGADPARAAHECIGRVLREQGRADETHTADRRRDSGKPCDWAAFGLLGTLNGGVRVTRPDGRQALAFDFAEPAIAES